MEKVGSEREELCRIGWERDGLGRIGSKRDELRRVGFESECHKRSVDNALFWMQTC